MPKYVYLFSEGRADMRNLLGGKGANLSEMTYLGLPVPFGFVISTEACLRYYDDGQVIAPEIVEEINVALQAVEAKEGKQFGDPENPLLVSVRSGARASMPGMMDTVLNLGLNSETVKGLAALTGNTRFALDSYRRFIMMFADVVMDIDKEYFEEKLNEVKAERGVRLDTELNADDMQDVVDRFLAVYKEKKGETFPQDPKEQLLGAIEAVFRSWYNDRAVYYRRQNNIPSSWGTAVNVQEMVYGNMGETSGTGVAFSRSPSDGTNEIFGEYLLNAQGEDVVAGVRTPEPLSYLNKLMPDIYQQFHDIAKKLEVHYKDMQDLEFTIERGKLFILQTRNGKRTAGAALKIAVDMVKEGLLTKEEALLKIDAGSLDTLLHPGFDPKALKSATNIAKGLPASPGAASGRITFSAARVVELAEAGVRAILVRLETSPEDIAGMDRSQGILTGRGGMTSHAAVVARGMGKCCVSGASELTINEREGYMIDRNGKRYTENDEISLDGSTGMVYDGAIDTIDAEMTGDFATIMEWADEVRVMQVRANADSPKDAAVARELGANGIGLTRTEHMFFDADRIFLFRQMIVAEDEAARRRALAKLLPIQQNDFEGIFEAMAGLPVTIRLLDPPLHEFLPTEDQEIEALAKELNLELPVLRDKIHALHELNPMMGHRGLRLAVSYPEIAEMQTEAIIRAAISQSRAGNPVVPEIMIPLASDPVELKYVEQIVRRTAEQIIKEEAVDLTYSIGAMIETPRAAILAGELAEHAAFFSFGTNDMTQLAYGLSRDDAGRILEDYYNAAIFETDPTALLDQKGVGRLMEIAVKESRAVKPKIKLGICGEHGGEPSSVKFCAKLGLDYVSCSPFRVPIARLAAAQAAITANKAK